MHRIQSTGTVPPGLARRTQAFLPACRSWMVLALLTLSGALLHAAPGSLDPAFSSDGLGFYNNAAGDAVALAEQADGTTLIAGFDGSNINLIRLLTNGEMDPAFGTAGKVTITLGFITQCAGLIALPDGKVLFAGSAVNGVVRNFQILRLLANGSPDPGFGTGGKTVTIFDGDYSATPTAMVRYPDGRILLAGQASTRESFSVPILSQYALARYLPDGAPDLSFGTAGKVLTHLGTSATTNAVTGMVLQPDGRILVAGNSTVPGRRSLAVVRYAANGGVDAGFANAGVLTFTDAIFCEAIALRPDGRILLGCSETSVAPAAIIRVHPGGALDDSFTNGGYRTFTSNDGAIRCRGIIVGPNGKILFATTVTRSLQNIPLLLRLKSDGGFDTGFGGNGAAYPLNGTGRVGTLDTIKLRPDGKILLAGGTGTTPGGATHYFAARLDGDGPYASPLAAWRQTHFGTTENAGPAADTADPDGDGVSNLFEYAFQQLPNSAASRTIPEFARDGDVFFIEFPDPDPTGSKLLAFSVEATANPGDPAWVQLTDNDPGPGYLGGLNMTGNPRAFFRLRVAADVGP